jgi:Delta7-sterol 5-desaturase
MLSQLLDLPDHPLVIFLTLSAGGLLIYFVLAGVSYMTFFVWAKVKFHPAHPSSRRDNVRSIQWSVFSVLGNAVLTMPFHLLMAHGYSQMYYDVSAHSWGWIAIQVVLLLLWTETCIYWIHWGLHRSDWLYENVHKPHHSFRVTTSLAGVAFNPLDSFVQALPHHLAPFLFPMHIGVYMTFVAFVTLWAVMIHDRLSFVRIPIINYTGHHTLHHWYFDYNFGQFFTFWDRLNGTYRNPEVRYQDVPDWVLRPREARPQDA